MPRYAVSHIAFSDNVLTTEIHEASDWRDAAARHEKIAELFTVSPDEEEEADEETEDELIIPEDQEEAKLQAFDCVAMINVVEIPS